MFTKFSLSPYFKAVVTSDHIQYGKPSPEIYLTAAQRAGAKPEDCLVAEDSAAGVAAAKAAQCYCLGLTTTQSEANLKREGADFMAPDYTSLPVAIALP